MTIQLPDDHIPGERWEFNEDVTKKFDSMLERSIPGYLQMRDLVFRLGRNFINDRNRVIDLGASRGESSAALIEAFPNTRFLLCEISEPMRNELLHRFHDNQNVFVRDFDLRQNTKDIYNLVSGWESANTQPASLVLAILTLIFVPINFRQSIIQGIYDGLPQGGAFIMVEKVLGNSALTQELLVKEYHNLKHDNGYSWEDIERKRASLEGVQVPVSHEHNMDMLHSAGFRRVECFWRNLNFAAFIAIKD